MNELNKAELRRLAEAIKEGCGLQGENAEEAMYDFECAATPDAVLLLLDECDRLQATCEGLDRQNDAIAEKIGKVAAERAAALVELEACRKDADRYRWLRDGSGWPAVFDNSDDPEPLRGNDLDAAMSREQSK